MPIKNILVTLIIALVVFEVIEHVVFPLFWLLKNRRKKSVCGEVGMLGAMVEVRQWENKEGRVFVKGELWNAVSDVSFSKGDKARIESVEGLTLRIKPF